MKLLVALLLVAACNDRGCGQAASPCGRCEPVAIGEAIVIGCHCTKTVYSPRETR